MTFKTKADSIGVISSSLCLIHCIATPFLFIAKACSDSCCAETPIWWRTIDYAFLIISFIAIHFATKNSNKKWVKLALWFAWGLMLFTILAEVLEPNLLPEKFIYIPALSIVALHLYNRKYCKCAGSSCCA